MDIYLPVRWRAEALAPQGRRGGAAGGGGSGGGSGRWVAAGGAVSPRKSLPPPAIKRSAASPRAPKMSTLWKHKWDWNRWFGFNKDR